MRRHRGVVVGGRLRMTEKMQPGQVTQELFDLTTGVSLVPGTFNVQVAERVRMPRYAGRIERKDITGELGDTIYIVSARVEDIDGWVIRHLFVDHYDGPAHRQDVLEFISDVHVRSKLGVTDGDEVTIEF